MIFLASLVLAAIGAAAIGTRLGLAFGRGAGTIAACAAAGLVWALIVNQLRTRLERGDE